MQIMSKFDFNQKISSYLAFILILILSFIVAWNALKAGNTIIEGAPNSTIFNPAGNELKK